VIFLLKLLARLPLPLLHGLGIALGWFLYGTSGRYAGRLRNNLFNSGLCTPGRDCRRLLRQVIGESGKAVVELLPVWLRPFDKVVKLVKGTSGWEHIDAARVAGKGIILIGPHVGCFEIINLYYASLHPFTAMYKPPRKPVLAALMLAGRQRGQATLVPTDLSGVRAQLAALKRHEAIGILPDQVAAAATAYGRRSSGVRRIPRRWSRACSARPAPPPFSSQPNASWGRGYHIHVFPLDTPLPADKSAAALLINRGVEDVIRRFPTQYMWSYNRHKRPGGVTHPDDPPET